MNKNLFLHIVIFFILVLFQAHAQTIATKESGTIQFEAAESLFDTQSEETALLEKLTGEELLAACAARTPADPVKMSGRITMRRKYGIEIKQFNFVAAMHWGAQPPNSTYELYTLSGTEVERVHTIRDKTGLSITRFTGPEQTPASTPAVNEKIQDTDITWLDLTMDFLWWKDPEITGGEKIKGRYCDILEVKPIQPLAGCAKVRLWIDREHKVVMQAAQVNDNGKESRKMWIRAIQKVENRWVPRDIEVETIGSGHRTRLHVTNVEFT